MDEKKKKMTESEQFRLKHKSVWDSDSPLWPFLYFFVSMISITVILALSATDFDITEGKTIGTFAPVSGLLSFLIWFISKKNKE